jgi:hypothetical protein
MYFRPSLYNPASLVHVLPQLVHLRHVEFDFGTRVTSEILNVVIELPALRSLVFDHTQAAWGCRVGAKGSPADSSHSSYHMWPGWIPARWDHPTSDLTKTVTRARERGVHCTGTAVEALGWLRDRDGEAHAAILMAQCSQCLARYWGSHSQSS